MDTSRNWSRIIGLDLSKATFKGCILYGEGFVQRMNFRGEMKRDESGYVLIKNTIQDGDIVLLEAGSSSFSLARYLQKNSKASEVVVLNPAHLRIIWDSQRKNDKADAMKIACIARDMRPEAWPRVTVPSEQEQSERSVIMHWVFLRKQETMLCNRFFALFNSLGYPEIDKSRLKKDSDFRIQTINELLSFNELAFTDAVMLEQQISIVQQQLTIMEDRLRNICLDHPRQALAWLSIPGIGLINAATLIAYIGDGSRFTKPDQLMNYAGMVPKQNQSGTVDIKGKITKRGCTAIRRSIVQGAQVLIQLPPTCDITKFAYRKKKECPFNGKVAVAVANRMLRTGLALLHHNDLYRPMIEDGFDKLKRKLAGNKLQALVPYLTSN
ncbi:MAG: IS110 family transposase [Spirochaetales bacterium]|nr:IS110 family transposase [Spirochaetales bacterium]MBR0521450.1 IS110 family transposase [Spirochaetales bacterium]